MPFPSTAAARNGQREKQPAPHGEASVSRHSPFSAVTSFIVRGESNHVSFPPPSGSAYASVSARSPPCSSASVTSKNRAPPFSSHAVVRRTPRAASFTFANPLSARASRSRKPGAPMGSATFTGRPSKRIGPPSAPKNSSAGGRNRARRPTLYRAMP